MSDLIYMAEVKFHTVHWTNFAVAVIKFVKKLLRMGLIQKILE